MLKSMTGYGRGSCAGPAFNITVELRSVNYRYADYFLRIPREFFFLEERIRRLLKGKIGRGRVEVSIISKRTADGKEQLSLDKELAAAYLRAFQDLAEGLDIPLDLSVGELVQMPGVLEDDDRAFDEEALWPYLEKALQEALKGLLGQRIAEGRNLYGDLKERLVQLEALADKLIALVPGALEEQKARLESRLQEALGDSYSFDEGRLLMECAVLAEKMDIHEETVRLKSHLQAFDEALQESGGPVGRRLDFIAQEIFREINTVGAKSQDYRLVALVVEIKTELEKMREQIQNIE